MPKIELAPSILSANFSQLGADAKAALSAGGGLLHVDVMDGHFVPNITLGPPVVKSLRKAIPDAIFDCHLMIENRRRIYSCICRCGCDVDFRASRSLRASGSDIASD